MEGGSWPRRHGVWKDPSASPGVAYPPPAMRPASSSIWIRESGTWPFTMMGRSPKWYLFSPQPLVRSSILLALFEWEDTGRFWGWMLVRGCVLPRAMDATQVMEQGHPTGLAGRKQAWDARQGAVCLSPAICAAMCGPVAGFPDRGEGLTRPEFWMTSHREATSFQLACVSHVLESLTWFNSLICYLSLVWGSFYFCFVHLGPQLQQKIVLKGQRLEEGETSTAKGWWAVYPSVGVLLRTPYCLTESKPWYFKWVWAPSLCLRWKRALAASEACGCLGSFAPCRKNFSLFTNKCRRMRLPLR